MLGRIVLAVVVAAVVILACILIGSILVSLNIGAIVAVGNFLKTYSGAIGVLSGLWYYFSGSIVGPRQP